MSFGQRLLRPFRIRVITFEHTRIRVRSFPPLFTHEYIESLAERVVKGGTVYLEAGEHVVYETIPVPTSTTLRGEGVDRSRLMGPPLVECSCAQCSVKVSKFDYSYPFCSQCFSNPQCKETL